MPSLTPEEILEHARWMHEHQAECTVKQEHLFGSYFVSTRFLGIDLGFARFFRHRQHTPRTFETMAFAAADDGEAFPRALAQERCDTWQEAVEQHERVKAQVLKALKG